MKLQGDSPLRMTNRVGQSVLSQAHDRIPLMADDPNALLFALRDRGRVVSIAKMGETIYELDGKLYRTFLVPEKDRRPGEGPWRAEEIPGDSVE